MGVEDLKHTTNDDLRVEEILREAKRRQQERKATQRSEAKRRRLERAQRGVFWLANHWVMMINILIALYLGGAILAPVLMHFGYARPASTLYAFYHGFCHQYPFRSWFLFGKAAAYPLHAPIPILEMNRLRSFIGDAEVGYKLGLCQRDIAIYATMLAAGLIYGMIHKVVRVPPLPLWLYFTFGIMPMMLDGGVQWVSYAIWQFFPWLLPQPFETIPTLRTLTGSLFGLGVIGLGYPYLGEYFDDVRDTLSQRYGRQRNLLSRTPPTLGNNYQ